MKHLLFTLLLFATTTHAQISFQNHYGEPNQSEHGTSVVQLENGEYIVVGNLYMQNPDGGGHLIYGMLKRLDENGVELWSQTYSDPNSNFDKLRFLDIELTTDSAIVLTGFSNQGNGDGQDMFLCKMDVEGNLIWLQTYNAIFNQVAVDVTETNDGGFVLVGEHKFDGIAGLPIMKAIKTDSVGNVVWEYDHPNIGYDGISHTANSVVEDDLGNIYMCGRRLNYLSEVQEIFFLKLDPNGELLYQKSKPFNSYSSGTEILIKSNGNILVCGIKTPNFTSTPLTLEYDPDGFLLDQNEVTFNGSWQESTLSFYLNENDELTIFSYNEFFEYRLAKYSSGHNLIWNTFLSFENMGSTGGGKVIETIDGGCIAVGSSPIAGNRQILVFKLDSEGNVTSLDNLAFLNSSIQLYPNPAAEYFELQIPGSIQIEELKLVDITGKTVKIWNQPENRYVIDELNTGMYHLNIASDSGVTSKLLVID